MQKGMNKKLKGRLLQAERRPFAFLPVVCRSKMYVRLFFCLFRFGCVIGPGKVNISYYSFKIYPPHRGIFVYLHYCKRCVLTKVLLYMNKCLLPFILLAGMLMAGCSLDDDDEPKDVVREIMMSVSHETGITYDLFDTNAERPIECMLVKEEGGDGLWHTLVFGAIEGFTYVKGHAYELKVRKTILANPPADGSNCRYKLIEILDDREVTEPETPEEPVIESEADIEYYDMCPFDKYAIEPEIKVNKDGDVLVYGGTTAYLPYESKRIYVEDVLPKDDPNWIKFEKIPYMAYYAYVISPLTDEIRLVWTEGGGPMLKNVIPVDEYRQVLDIVSEGGELEYYLVLANIYKYGLQKLMFTVSMGQ